MDNSDEAIHPSLRASSSGNQYPNPPQHSNNSNQLSTTSSGHLTTNLPYPSHHDHSPHASQLTGYEHTPELSGLVNHGTPDSGGHGQDIGPDGQKRPRACEACRGLKVRCEFDSNDPDVPCKRCAKARRNCVVTQPSRKRQKKTDSRVAELEKKIDALTASLHAQQQHRSGTATEPIPKAEHPSDRTNPYEHVTNGPYPPIFDPRHDSRLISGDWEPPFPKPAEVESRKAAQPPMVIAGQKRKHQEMRSSPSGVGISSVFTTNPTTERMTPPLLQSEWSSGRPRGGLSDEYTDVIDRGLLTAEAAHLIFTRYTDKMAPLMPAVIFSPETTMAEVRKSKPVLFLAILSAASGSEHAELQRTLTKEVMQVYATRILCNGEKTLELIQALLVSTIWYWPPEHFEELKFYQLIHLAAVMAIDININRRNKTPKTRKMVAGFFRDHPWRRTPFPNPESVEARRAWISCYFMCCNTAMGLRRQNLIRWTSYIDECIEVLETSPDAAPSDKTLCQWVRSQHIAEEVGCSFSMDDPFAVVTISDPKVQYSLRGFERDLEKWSEQVPKECQSPILKMTENILSLYMHEIAMHVDHNVEEFKPPFTEESLNSAQIQDDSTGPLTPIHINALSTCLTAIDGIFTAFLSIDVDTLRVLPVLHFVRAAYAVVVLIKMYFAAAIEGSELGKVIDKDNMRVEFYLDNLLEQFRAAAADDKSRPSTKFSMVLVMLKTWFHRQRTSKQPAKDEEHGSTEQAGQETSGAPGDPAQASGQHSTQVQHQQQQKEYSPANTPLQLLSEVATGGNGQSRPESRNQFSSSSWDAAPAYNGYSQVPQSFDVSNMPYGMNIDPNLNMMSGMGYDINNGDGFQQAMGMTIGEGEFNYFSDDAFFGAVMDSVGGAQDMFQNF